MGSPIYGNPQPWLGLKKHPIASTEFFHVLFPIEMMSVGSTSHFPTRHIFNYIYVYDTVLVSNGPLDMCWTPCFWHETRSSCCWPLHAPSTFSTNLPFLLQTCSNKNHGPGLVDLEWLRGMANGGSIRGNNDRYLMIRGQRDQAPFFRSAFRRSFSLATDVGSGHVTPMLRWLCVLCILHGLQARNWSGCHLRQATPKNPRGYCYWVDSTLIYCTEVVWFMYSNIF